MAVSVQNVRQNHRSVYWEAVGDGVAVTHTVNHNRVVTPGTTMTVQFAGTAPSATWDFPNQSGGFLVPNSGTPLTVSSHSHTQVHSSTGNNGQFSVTTSVAIGNGTRAYFVATFDQLGNP